MTSYQPDDNVGARIRERRVAIGLTLRQLEFDGASYAYLSKIETGARTPTDGVLEQIARRLRTSASLLATGQPDDVDRGLQMHGLERGDLTDEERDQLEERVRDAAYTAALAFALDREEVAA